MDHLHVRTLLVRDAGTVERPPRLLAEVADRDRYEDVAALDVRSLPPHGRRGFYRGPAMILSELLGLKTESNHTDDQMSVVNNAEYAIRLRGFVKRFGSITAVDGLDLDVPFGTCVGLLGPNGAGKSTTMRALTAQVIPDEGELEVLGYRLPDDSKQARADMGVVPQLDNLDAALTVEQNLLVFAHLYRVPAADRTAAIERALRIANLIERRLSKVDQLSGGMRRR